METVNEQNLIAAGWKKIGNAFYPPHGTNGITCYEGKYFIWENHIPREVKIMNDLKTQSK